MENKILGPERQMSQLTRTVSVFSLSILVFFMLRLYSASMQLVWRQEGHLAGEKLAVQLPNLC